MCLTDLCTCTWKSEVDLNCHSLGAINALFYETGSLTA